MSVQGSLCLHQGVVWVGRWEKTAHVRSYDLDGRALEAGFSFRDPERPRSAATGISIDDEHRLWVADPPGACVRAFNLFGRQVVALRGPADLEERLPPPGSDLERGDVAGALGEPVDVVVASAEVLGRRPEDDPCLVVVSGGTRRHAVQCFDLETRVPLASLRPEGRAQGVFRGVRRVATHGPWLWVCEEAARRVQVFRSGVFHFAFRLEGGATPCALAPLPDGRLVVGASGEEGGLLLLDASGGSARFLADVGAGEGAVLDPDDLAVSQGADERHTRVVVLDRDGGRVQVFTLAGRCFGAFEEQAS